MSKRKIEPSVCSSATRTGTAPALERTSCLIRARGEHGRTKCGIERGHDPGSDEREPVIGRCVSHPAGYSDRSAPRPDALATARFTPISPRRRARAGSRRPARADTDAAQERADSPVSTRKGRHSTGARASGSALLQLEHRRSITRDVPCSPGEAHAGTRHLDDAGANRGGDRSSAVSIRASSCARASSCSSAATSSTSRCTSRTSRRHGCAARTTRSRPTAGLSEFYQYIKQFWIALCMAAVFIQTRSKTYLCWSGLFAFLHGGRCGADPRARWTLAGRATRAAVGAWACVPTTSASCSSPARLASS